MAFWILCSNFADEFILSFMATYTITVNERTAVGRNLVAYLRSLGVIKEEPNAVTRKAIKELKNGKVTRCSSFEDYLQKVK